MMGIAEELDELRLTAFRSNAESDRAAYFNRLSLAFQRGELVPADTPQTQIANLKELTRGEEG